MDIFVKPSRHRIDPKHPESTDPRWGAAYKKGQERIKDGKLKFENEAQKRDYERAISKNPSNVPGMPNFFPPLELKSFVSMPSATLEDIARERWEQWERNQIKDVDLWCEFCDKVTSHAISPRDCFCHKCGHQKPYKT